jgi:hypothetical protein
MSDLWELRESVNALVAGQARNAAILETVRDDMVDIKKDVKSLNELRGGLKVVRWGTSIAAAVIASLTTHWIQHGNR